MNETVTLQSMARQGEHGINGIDAVRAGGSHWETTLMKIFYWTLKSIPELSGLPSDERRHVWLDARRLMARRSWQFWVSVFGSLTVCITIGDMLIGHPPLGAFIGLVVATLINWQISVYLVRPYIRTLLSAEQA